MAGKKDKVKDSDRFSIITPELNRCFVCGTTDNIHLHEVFGGPYRANSKEDGLVIPLCAQHHNMSYQGIHFNKELDDRVKELAERYWIKENCNSAMTLDDKIGAFIRRYGRNYIDD